MGLRAESGGARLIASGEITSFFAAPIVLHLDDWRYSVAIAFGEDEGEVRLDVHNSDEGVELFAFNFRDGRGTADPMPLVQRDGVGLWWHFRVFRHGSSDDVTLHYTVWARPVDAD